MSKTYNQHLKDIPIFAGLSEKELEAVSALATELDEPSGFELIKEGTLAHEMFVIVDGEFAVSRDGEQIATLGAGDFVGEVALLTHHHRNASVTVTSDSATVIHIDGRGFSNLLENVPQIAVKMLPIVAERLSPHVDT